MPDGLAGRSTRKLRSWTTRDARKRMIGLSVSMRCAGPESWTKVVHLPGYPSRARARARRRWRHHCRRSSRRNPERGFLTRGKEVPFFRKCLSRTDVCWMSRRVAEIREGAQHPTKCVATHVSQRDERYRSANPICCLVSFSFDSVVLLPVPLLCKFRFSRQKFAI
jgi:hypothetical protein